jgi:hypothetical protein
MKSGAAVGFRYSRFMNGTRQMRVSVRLTYDACGVGAVRNRSTSGSQSP